MVGGVDGGGVTGSRWSAISSERWPGVEPRVAAKFDLGGTALQSVPKRHLWPQCSSAVSTPLRSGNHGIGQPLGTGRFTAKSAGAVVVWRWRARWVTIAA